jgi:hypothetical protein
MRRWGLGIGCAGERGLLVGPTVGDQLFEFFLLLGIEFRTNGLISIFQFLSHLGSGLIPEQTDAQLALVNERVDVLLLLGRKVESFFDSPEEIKALDLPWSNDIGAVLAQEI